MVEVRRPGGAALYRAPLLAWCPACGGIADYRYAGDGQRIRVECEGCGMRTSDMISAEQAGASWNRRTTNGARMLSLPMLLNSEFDMPGDDGGAAVWLEISGVSLRAAILVVGLDMGAVTVTEIDANDNVTEWTRDWIGAEGAAWRLWDRKPTAEERAKAPWYGENWRPARAMPKLYNAKEDYTHDGDDD